jgi:creatinine amidohydrolase
LPYGTDNIQAKYVAQASARLAWERGTRCVVLPGIDYGVNTGQLDIPLCMNMNPSTQLMILKDVCTVLVRHNIPTLVILNGHGANQFTAMLRELAGIFPQLFICVVNWYQAAPRQAIFEKPGDHADELETSVMLHIAPALVQPLETAGNGAAKSFLAEGFKRGWAWTQRPWTLISTDTGSGDPSGATNEKGQKFLEMTTNNIADFFCDIAGKSFEELIG